MSLNGRWNVFDINHVGEYIKNNILPGNQLNFKNCTFGFSLDIKFLYSIFDELKILYVSFENVIFSGVGSFKNYESTTLHFTGCEFRKDADFSESNIKNSSLHFYRCSFGGILWFSKATLNDLLLFNQCIFNDSFIAENYKGASVSFQKCEFEDNNKYSSLNLRNIDLSSELILKNSNIMFAKIDLTDSNIKDKIDFSGSNISSAIHLSRATFNRLSFENSQLSNDLFIDNCGNIREIKFHYARHNNGNRTIRISNITLTDQQNFRNALYPRLEMDNVTFEEQVDFSGSTFLWNLNFNDVTFNKKLYFHKSKFDSSVNFWNCNFNDTVKFVDISSVFDFREFNFNFSTVSGLFMIDVSPDERGNDDNFERLHWSENIGFDYCFLKDSSLLIVRAIRSSGKLSFDYANIFGRVILQDVEFHCISMENAAVTGDISLPDDAKFKKVTGRNTARILKHEAQKNSDKLNYLNFRMKEHKQIYRMSFKGPKFKDKIKGIPEAAVYWLNDLSSDHGRSWFKGIVFTVSVSALFVCALQKNDGMIRFTLNPKEIWKYLGIFWNDVLKFLWLPDMLEKEMVAWQKSSWTLYVLGKILVGFGIYQTIAAFRRFGK